MLWGIFQVLVAWQLVGAAAGEPGQSVMGGLYWCNTMCVCLSKTQSQVQCFERRDIYNLLGFTDRMTRRLLKANFTLESTVHWCNDLCLCHKSKREFKCIEEEDLNQFINRTIGDMYFYNTGDEVPPEESSREEEVVLDQEERVEEAEHNKRSEKRRNRKNRKPKKNARAREEDITTEAPIPEAEPEPTTTQQVIMLETTTTPLTTSPLTTTLETSPPPDLPQLQEDSEEEEEEAEMLPKQEAVAASPAVTALQPPTRRQPFPTSVSARPPPPHASTKASHTPAAPPKVSAVLEVPVERKTVASEVSQDLDELGSTVMQIKDDVVLNQRILLVTVAVAGIAMLG